MNIAPRANVQADQLLRRIQSARQICAAGGGTVLDVLVRGSECPLLELDAQLRRFAGVAAVTEDHDPIVDWSSLLQRDAQALCCLPLRLPNEPGVRIGLADPWDDARVREIAAAVGQVPELAAVSDSLLRLHLGARSPARSAAHEAPAQTAAGAANGLVVEFVDSAIGHACDVGASDVHFECDRQGVTVKLRRDGVMAHLARLDDRQRAEEVISRIKVLAQLDITERRTPQDGRFRWLSGGRSMDMRVSIMPSIHGEDAVLRLLDKAQLRARGQAMSLDHLGFAAPEGGRIRDLAQLPHGMLLVTGPTGSGKTTTLYAVVCEFNDGLGKIITIEDPVEYELPGVLQIPVNERKGLTFAKGLRSILRHDPDRILVGEIRDAETAEIAVQSALTGHQVLTTVHANSIFDVVGRFRHFGLDMFGFMSSLNGVVVQRLLRRLCARCTQRRACTGREAAWLAGQGMALDSVPAARGCEHCQGSGYRGRGVIAEVHAVDDPLRDLITSGAPLSALGQHVHARGAVPLAGQGARLVAAGITTLDEVRRVVGWV